MEANPAMVENSVWSANGTDIVVAFPIVPKVGSIFKKDLLGVKQLEFVKSAQQVWVEQGTNVDLCRDKRIRHNVSNTITVDDWDAVTEYVYKNRHSLCGISFLAASGDKAYAQAPNTEVFTMNEIISKYGEEAMFTSALIEHAMRAFNADLWTACIYAIGDRSSIEVNHTNADKLDWLRRFDKFATNFTSKEECSYCLKDVYNLHKVWKINKSLQNIDWSKISKQTYTDIDTMGAVACAGGRCEL